jgi:hypothetical protein
MTFDLLSTVGITAGSTVVVATFVALFGSSLTQRVAIGVAMALWFIGVLWIGAPGTISTPVLGAAVLFPVAVSDSARQLDEAGYNRHPYQR